MPLALDTVSPGLDKARFKFKVRRFLDRHRDRIALLKLRRAEALTATDLGELDRIFAEIAAPDDDEAHAEITAAGGSAPSCAPSPASTARPPRPPSTPSSTAAA